MLSYCYNGTIFPHQFRLHCSTYKRNWFGLPRCNWNICMKGALKRNIFNICGLQWIAKKLESKIDWIAEKTYCKFAAYSNICFRGKAGCVSKMANHSRPPTHWNLILVYCVVLHSLSSSIFFYVYMLMKVQKLHFHWYFNNSL